MKVEKRGEMYAYERSRARLSEERKRERERVSERLRKISRSGSGSVVTESGDVQQRATNQRDRQQNKQHNSK